MIWLCRTLFFNLQFITWSKVCYTTQYYYLFLGVLDQKFYFVSFICLLEEPKFQPIEVAATEFSLLNGRERDFHRHLDPGTWFLILYWFSGPVFQLSCYVIRQRKSKAMSLLFTLDTTLKMSGKVLNIILVKTIKLIDHCFFWREMILLSADLGWFLRSK